MFADTVIQVPGIGLGLLDLTAMLVSNGENLAKSSFSHSLACLVLLQSLSLARRSPPLTATRKPREFQPCCRDFIPRRGLLVLASGSVLPGSLRTHIEAGYRLARSLCKAGTHGRKSAAHALLHHDKETRGLRDTRCAGGHVYSISPRRRPWIDVPSSATSSATPTAATHDQGDKNQEQKGERKPAA